MVISGLWLSRAKGWIGGTCQQRNRLRRATAPFNDSAIFSTCWRLHVASRHSVDRLRTARQSGMHGVSLDIENYCTASLFFEQTCL